MIRISPPPGGRLAPVQFLTLLLLGTAAVPAQTQSLSLLPVADTTLFQFAPTNNLGGTVNLLGGTTMNGARNRPLLRFDLSSIPAESTIHSVTLTLTDTLGGSFQPSNFQLHRLLVDWGEGTKTGNQGQPATTGEATWNARLRNLTEWAVPGALAGTDYVAAVSGATLVSPALGTNVYTFDSTATMVADVQLWLDSPGMNFGWILISDNESTPQTSRRFGSREDTQGRAPVLTVEFTPVPEPRAIALLLTAGAFMLWRRSRQTQPPS